LERAFGCASEVLLLSKEGIGNLTDVLRNPKNHLNLRGAVTIFCGAVLRNVKDMSRNSKVENIPQISESIAFAIRSASVQDGEYHDKIASMDAPHYEPPLRKLITEPGFWFCVLPNLLYFILTSENHEGNIRYTLMIFTLFSSQIMGIIWMTVASRQRVLQRLGVCVACTLFCLGSGWGHLSFRLRTLVSLPALAQVSARLERGEKVTFPRQVGLFTALSGRSRQHRASLTFRELFTGGEGHLVKGWEPETDIRECYMPLVGGWKIYISHW
jgi:hypothetical protein